MARAARGRAGSGAWSGVAAAVAALLAAAGLGGCSAAPSSTAAPASAADTAALADRLPAVAAGFRRVEARPAGGAGQRGREVSYATGGGPSTAAATVELLADNTGTAAALDAVLADALSAGPAREVREAGRFAVAAAGGSGAVSPLSCAETAGRYGREPVAGLVCAGRAGAALVRIKVAMPAGRGPPPADPRAFAEAIAAALSSGSVPPPG